ncbi:MAG: glycerol-3-phosphate 1-O-acyltransferase PlsY [Planctomycetota bacterium]|jgi:glycerol-3-phosphate acyltransferase PlsY
MLTFLPLIIFAYLLGALPFGFLIGKAHGKDLRQIGSGNIGATNAARVLGKKWGIICFLLDVGKGLVPMLLVPALGLIAQPLTTGQLVLWILVGVAAVLGHVFPVYLGFKGGKGVATSLGIVLGLWPYFTVCGIAVFVIWAATLAIWRYVSLSSIIAAVSFPFILIGCIISIESWSFNQLWPLVVIAVLMAMLVIVRHRTNIVRLRNGSETKVFQKQD